MVEKIGKARLIFIVIALALVAIFLLFRFNSENQEGVLPTPTKVELGEYAGYTIINRYPHDPSCYTQGLLYHEGFFYESCGLYGESKLRKVELESGQVLRQVELEDQYFAEGLALLDGLLYQLTWQEGQAFVYDLETFELVRKFQYNTEGWGLTTDGDALLMTDGSNKLFWLDPGTGFVVREDHITWQGQPIQYLNELELINGELYANIYLTDRIALIDPATGQVLTMLDLSGLCPDENLKLHGEVLNGIAYDQENDRLFVTGKHWPWLYEISLRPIPEPIIPTLTLTPTSLRVPIPEVQGP